jgi:hypothetical protein
MIKRLFAAVSVLLALTIFEVASANAASALGIRQAFTAVFSGQAVATSPTTFTFTGTGKASYMGPVTTVGHLVVTGLDSSCPNGIAVTNVETLTDALHETLTLTLHDVACPTGPGQFAGTGTWKVTGGTGRFSAVSGSGTGYGNGDLNVGTFNITLTGSLTAPLILL